MPRCMLVSRLNRIRMVMMIRSADDIVGQARKKFSPRTCRRRRVLAGFIIMLDCRSAELNGSRSAVMSQSATGITTKNSALLEMRYGSGS